VKYTRGRPIAIVEVDGALDGGEARYTVKDNGAGFDPRYSDKLFTVFQRLHKASEFEGTGVGLALVERIVSRHGGRVWAEGRPSVGATFGFALPHRGIHD
jgi:light-regulated signal transduction histidine kinase (bacteriophytochrome)